MLNKEEILTLLKEAVEKRDASRRDENHETGEWWDGYRAALQRALSDDDPTWQALQKARAERRGVSE